MIDLISIIIPVYNTGNALLKCIESIERNTYSNIEVLIIDDGSTEKTSRICDKCANLYENVIVFHRKNKGVSAARNYGLEKANGKYITFVDADDIIEPLLIEKLYNLCEINNADISQCDYYECIEGKKLKRISIDLEKVIHNDDILKTFYLKKDIRWSVWGKMYKKSCIKNIRFPIGKRVAEDMYFVYQVCMQANKMVFSKEALYYYNKNEVSAMADRNLVKFFDSYELVKKVWENKKNTTEKERVFANAFYIDNEIWFMRFMIARGAKGETLNHVKEIRNEIISNTISEAVGMLGMGRRIEYCLIKYSWTGFYILSKIQTRKMK